MENYERNAQPDGKVTITDVNHSEAKASNTLRLPSNAQFIYKVIKSSHGIDLPINIQTPQSTVVKDALKTVMKEQGGILARFKHVSRDIAHVSITEGASGYSVCLNDAEVNRHGVKVLPHVIPPNTDRATFEKILRGIAAYQYHLRHSKHSPSRVSLGLCRIEQGNQLGTNLNLPGVGVDLVEDDSSFAITITNNMQYNLYPALFYFDNCDFSIRECI